MSLTYGDLFGFIEDKVNFHKDDKGKLQGNCSGTIERPFVKEFFASNPIDSEAQERVLKIFNETGGWCDCEILMNSAHGFPRDIPLSEKNVEEILAKRLAGVKVANKERKRLHRNELQQKRRQEKSTNISRKL